jgi:hypothetical protein
MRDRVDANRFRGQGGRVCLKASGGELLLLKHLAFADERRGWFRAK